MHATLNGRVIGYVVIALSLISVALGVKTSIDRDNDVECTTRFIAENARVSKIRADAAARRNMAVDTVILSTGASLNAPPPKTPAEAAKANRRLLKLFTDFEAEVMAVRAEQARNPLPPFPDDCSDLR